MITSTQSSIKPGQTHGQKKSRGFTLVELLIVVAIIGILAAIAVPNYFRYIDKAKITVAFNTLDTIRKNLELFHINYQRYPANINFTTGQEDPPPPPPEVPQTVLSNSIREQVVADLIVTNAGYNYNSATLSYTLTVNAKDRARSVLTLTPVAITKAP